jgi:Dictyostelium (slime mold) repeat
MGRLSVVFCLALTGAACSVIDSVSGYAGPPEQHHTVDGGGGAAGSAGSPAAGAAGKGCSSTASCDDGNACNGTETCGVDGSCAKGLVPSTDDQNDCTLDSCDPKKGVQHEMQSFDTVIQCSSVSNDCAPDYYRSTLLCCYAPCGDCPFYVNAVSCDKACFDQVDVCCGVSAADCDAVPCPAGYTKGAVKPSTCTCAVDGFAVTCQR